MTPFSRWARSQKRNDRFRKRFPSIPLKIADAVGPKTRAILCVHQIGMPCDLAALVEETIALVRPQCEHARISLRWQKPPMSFSQAADPNQLRQVILNLVTNAIEAAGPGGLRCPA